MLFQSFKSFRKRFEGNLIYRKAWPEQLRREGKEEIGLVGATLCGCPSDSNDSLGEDCLDDFLEAFAHFAVVGERLDEAGLAGEPGGEAGGDELAGVDQQPSADAFLQAMLAEISHFAAEADDLSGEFFRHAAFMFDDAGFDRPPMDSRIRWRRNVGACSVLNLSTRIDSRDYRKSPTENLRALR